MSNEDLNILSSLLSSVVTNWFVENTLCPIQLKKEDKFYAFVKENIKISASNHHKKINDGSKESSILWL